MSAGEPALPHICYAVASVRERFSTSSFCPCHGWQAEKVGPSGVMKAGEMVLPLTSLGQHSRTDLMAGVWVTSPEG